MKKIAVAFGMTVLFSPSGDCLGGTRVGTSRTRAAHLSGSL